MASNVRQQLESWLKTIDVTGNVADVGGVFMPVKGRTKTWDPLSYDIMDIKSGRNGVKARFVFDLNQYYFLPPLYDTVFCLETFNHLWNPITALHNINRMLKKNGVVYLSLHFIFPHHSGADSLRYTRIGISKLLTESGFDKLVITPRFAKDVNELKSFCHKESKVVKFPGEIGYLIKAVKVKDVE